MPDYLATLADVEVYLNEQLLPRTSSDSYTLERMVDLMNRLDNPQDKLKVIHVAGTSGKTSTAYYIRTLLEVAGQRTGLTASPHIMSVTERLQIDGHPLDEKRYIQYFNEFKTVTDSWPDLGATYFEYLTAFAYWVFAKEKVDYAVIEVGLGGTLDATNVVNREDKVCVITTIGLDHTKILGSTVAEIAEQKAGIIGEGQTVFSAKQYASAAAAIEKRVQSLGAQLDYIELVEEIPELPLFQQQNFCLAQTAFDYVAERDKLRPLSPSQVSNCYKKTPPGRFEQFSIDGKTVILDGAHNPQKLQGLVDTLQYFDIPAATWLVGFIEAPERKITDCLEIIASANPQECIFTDFRVDQDISGRQSVPPDQLSRDATAFGLSSEAIIAPHEALDLVLKKPATTIIVTGSLYLVAVLRPLLIERSN